MKIDIPDKILEKVSIFPSMPQAGIKLRALLAKEDVSTAEIEEILRRDPGLAANVLRLANSAYFGIPNKVSTLKHAVILLGVQRFSKIAVTACMNKVGVENSNLLPEIVYLANLLCQPKCDPDSAEGEHSMPYSSVLNRLSINSEQYKVFAETAGGWMKKLSDTLTFD
jgi:hypothetical protein